MRGFRTDNTWNTRERAETMFLAFHWAKRIAPTDLWPFLEANGWSFYRKELDRVFDGFLDAFDCEDPDAFDCALNRFRLLVRCGTLTHRKLGGKVRVS